MARPKNKKTKNTSTPVKAPITPVAEKNAATEEIKAETASAVTNTAPVAEVKKTQSQLSKRKKLLQKNEAT